MHRKNNRHRSLAVLLSLTMVFQNFSFMAFADEFDSPESNSPSDTVELSPEVGGNIVDEEGAPDEAPEEDGSVPYEDNAPAEAPEEDGSAPDEDNATEEAPEEDGSASDEEGTPEETTEEDGSAPEEDGTPEETPVEDGSDPEEDSAPEENEDDADNDAEEDEDNDPDEEVSPTFDHLYFSDDIIAGIDFSTKRLLVGTSDESVFTWDTNVISEYDGVYLLGFETEYEAMSAYTYYYSSADFVESDIALFVADSSYVGAGAYMDTDALSKLRVLSETEIVLGQPEYDIALIDTGVSDGLTAAVSVIGEDSSDDNGHGTRMLEAVRSVSSEPSVLSVKAFDSHGVGSISSVYAAMVYAASHGARTIDLSFAAESVKDSTVLSRAVDMAENYGIIVIGAAGNDNADVSGYLPGRIDGVYIVGACDETGTKLPTSNYGENVFCNVTAGSSSEAAAKLSAFVAAYGMDEAVRQMNQGLIFETDYEEIIFEVHDKLVETGPSDSYLLDLPQLEPETISSINNDVLPVAVPFAAANEDKTVQPEQDPMTEGSVTIHHVYVRWRTPSDDNTPADFGTLELAPQQKELSDHQFQIDFTLSGQYEYAPGDIEITFPAYIWTPRGDEDGEYGSLTLSVPEDPTAGTEFVWRREGDKIIITNDKTIAAASTIMIQGTFCNMLATEIANDTTSEDFYATVTVKVPNGDSSGGKDKNVSMNSNVINAHIETFTEVKNAEKNAYNQLTGNYDVWWESIPSDIPEELLPDDEITDGSGDTKYGYVRWYVAGSADGSQPFRLYVHDAISDEEIARGGMMLGVSHCAKEAPNSQSELRSDVYYMKASGNEVDALLFNGYSTTTNTAYVWTAYDKNLFPDYEGEMEILTNEMTVYVEGYDGNAPKIKEKEADATVKTKKPTTYKFTKVWDDDNNKEGNRPTEMDLLIFRKEYSYDEAWKIIHMTADNNAVDENTWECTWTDGGQESRFFLHENLYKGSGVKEEKYNEQSYYLNWYYYLAEQTPDPDLEGSDKGPEWKFVNKYIEKWLIGDTSQITKSITYPFDDYKPDSKRDGLSLNKLLRGSDVYVPYNISATVSASVEYMESEARAEHSFMLEDSVYRFLTNKYLETGTELGIDDIDIGAVTINAGSCAVYDYQLDDPQTYPVTGETYYPKMQRLPMPPINLYGKQGKNAEWQLLATLNYNNNGSYALTPAPGSPIGADDISDLRVSLPEGFSDVRLAIENSTVAYVNYKCSIELRVHPTAAVKDMIEKSFGEDRNMNSVLILQNTANIYSVYTGENTVYNGREYIKGTRSDELKSTAGAYLHGRPLKVAADLNKSFEMLERTDADITSKRIKLHTTLELTQQSNITDLNDYKSSVSAGEIPNSSAGTFYDLLPVGAEPDLSTVRVTNGGSVADRRIIQNYNGSGRTLLVVEVNFTDNIKYYTRPKDEPAVEEDMMGNYRYNDSQYPTEGYKNSHTIEFDSYISIYDAYDQNKDDNGAWNDMYNLSAFEDDGDRIGSVRNWSGDPNDPTAGNNVPSQKTVGEYADGSYAGLMTDLLGSGRTDGSFVYAGAELKKKTLNFDAFAYLDKKVQAKGSGYWTDGLDGDAVNVQEGGPYRYSLTVKSGMGTVTSNIILVDFLEDYVPTGQQEGVGDGFWKGTFSGVDTSEIKGTTPKIYYSTAEFTPEQQAIYTDNKTKPEDIKDLLDNSALWTTTKPADEDVTAVAIDLGSNFELKEKEVAIVYIDMYAPFLKDVEKPYYFNGTDGNDPDANFHAYNKSYVACYKADADNGKPEIGNMESFYTKVGIFARNVKVRKVWDDDKNRDGKRPAGIKVQMYANGKEEGDPLVLNDGNNWEGEFKRVLTYDENNKDIIYTYTEEFIDPDNVMDEGDYTLKITKHILDNGDTEITLTNTHDPERISIPVTKNWLPEEGTGNIIYPASIKVWLVANGERTEDFIILRADANGNWAGEFSNIYKYYFDEEENVSKEIVYTLEEDPIDDFVFVSEEHGEENAVILTNQYRPYGDLKVMKILTNVNDANKDKEFTFNLELWVGEEYNASTALKDSYPYTIYRSSEDGSDDVVTGSGTIGSGGIFQLRHGEYIVVENIHTSALIKNARVNVRYRVAEVGKTGYELTGSVNDSGEIRSWECSEAVFENTSTTRGNIKLEAQKVLHGQKDVGYKFNFEMYEVDENDDRLDAPARISYTNSKGGISFATISYDSTEHNSVHYYIIEEKQEGKPGYTYDDTKYKVKVTVTDDGEGKITCTPEYFIRENDQWIEYTGETVEVGGESRTYSVPVFENSYRAEGSVELSSWKTIRGGELDGEEFSFELYKLEGSAPVRIQQDIHNNTDGIITFASLDYSEEDIGNTYWYFARETDKNDDPDLNEFIFDTTIIGYKIEVYDNGDGNLRFNQNSYNVTAALTECADCHGTGKTGNEGDDCEECGGFGYSYDEDTWNDWIKNSKPARSDVPMFENGLEDGSLTITKRIDDDSTGYAADTEFTFNVTLIGDNYKDEEPEEGAEPEVKYIRYTLTMADGTEAEKEAKIENGKFTVTLKADETALIGDIPAGTVYQISEEQKSGWMLVSQSNASGVIPPADKADAVFTNLYDINRTSVIIAAYKFLDDHPANPTKDGETFRFVLKDSSGNTVKDGNGNDMTAAAQAGGLIEFERIIYESTGTFEYTISEIEGQNTDEIRYDKSEKKVTVVVDIDKEGNFFATVKYGENNDRRFDNYTIPGSLELSKTGLGSYYEYPEGKEPVFYFNVTFKNDNHMPFDADDLKWYIRDKDGTALDQGFNKLDASSAGSASGETSGGGDAADVSMNASMNMRKVNLYSSAIAANAVMPLAQLVSPTLEDGEVLYANNSFGKMTSANSAYSGVMWSVIKSGSDVVLQLEPLEGNEGMLSDWAVRENGVATIRPWNAYKANITSIRIKKKVYTSDGTNGNPVLFNGMTSLKTADLTGLDASKTTSSLANMFASCGSLTTVTLGGFQITKTSSAYNMFGDCSSLTTINGVENLVDLSENENVNASYGYATSINQLFMKCGSLEKIDVSGWDLTTKGGFVDTGYIFQHCTGLKEIKGIENWDTSYCVNLQSTFNNCSSLTSLDLSNWKVNRVTNFMSTFSGCGVTELNLSGWEFEGSNPGSNLLGGADSLVTLDISGWHTGKMTNIAVLPYNNQIKHLNMSNWYIDESLRDASGFLSNSKALETLDLSGWNWNGKMVSGSNVFSSCNTPKEITIDSKFFTGLSAPSLHIVPSIDTSGHGFEYSGKWVAKSDLNNIDADAYEPDQLTTYLTEPNNDIGPTTYVWQRANYRVIFDPGEIPPGAVFSGMMNGTYRSFSDEPYELEACDYIPLGDDYKDYRFIGWMDADTKGTGNEVIYGADKDTLIATIPENKYENGKTVTLIAVWQKADEIEYVKITAVHKCEDINAPGQYTTVTDTTIHEVARSAGSATIAPKEYNGCITPASQTVTISANEDTYQIEFRYKRMRYTIIFDGNGADDYDGSMTNPLSMVVGIDKILGNGYSKDNSAFLGWNTKQDGSGRMYSAFDPVSIDASDGDTVTLYAQWMEIGAGAPGMETGVLTVWCKAGQTVVFPTLPAGLKYEIEEIDIPLGWAQAAAENDKIITGNISINSTSRENVVNKYSAKGVDKIEAHKRFEGASLEPGAFIFELSSDEDFKTQADPIVKASGALDENGDYEETVTSFSAKSWRIEVTEFASTGGNSALYVYGSDDDAELIATVTSSGAGVITVPGTTVRLKAHNAQYTVQLTEVYWNMTAVNGPADTTKDTTVGSDTVTNPWYEMAPVTFDGIEFTKPGTYTFYIREKCTESELAEAYKDYIQYDDHKETVKVVVTDENGTGYLTTSITYVGKDQYAGKGAVFCNRMAEGTLSIGKTLENAGAAGIAADKMFEFTVDLKDITGNALSGEYDIMIETTDRVSGEVTTSTDTLTVENGSGKISIKDGQKVTIKGLPHGAAYDIIETPIENFEQRSCSGDSGKIEGGKNQEAEFINIYKPEAVLTIPVKKIYEGGDLSTKQFVFELYKGEAGQATFLSDTSTDNVGSAVFTIHYDINDIGNTYKYYICEDSPDPMSEEHQRIRYNNTMYTFEVEITNSADGKLVLTVSPDDGAIAEAVRDNDKALEITNVALFELDVTKTVIGSNDNKNEPFSFTLTLTNDKYELEDLTYTIGSESGDLAELKDQVHDGQYNFTLKHGETITFGKLPYGTRYTIEEAAQIAYVVSINVSGDPTASVSGRTVSGTMQNDAAAEYVNDTVFNLLPETGGKGTVMYTAAGMILLLSAAAYVGLEKKRQSKENRSN